MRSRAEENIDAVAGLDFEPASEVDKRATLNIFFNEASEEDDSDDGIHFDADGIKRDAQGHAIQDKEQIDEANRDLLKVKPNVRGQRVAHGNRGKKQQRKQAQRRQFHRKTLLRKQRLQNCGSGVAKINLKHPKQIIRARVGPPKNLLVECERFALVALNYRAFHSK